MPSTPKDRFCDPDTATLGSTQVHKAAGVHICRNRTLGLNGHKFKSCCTDSEGVEIMQITKDDIQNQTHRCWGKDRLRSASKTFSWQFIYTGTDQFGLAIL